MVELNTSGTRKMKCPSCGFETACDVRVCEICFSVLIPSPVGLSSPKRFQGGTKKLTGKGPHSWGKSGPNHHSTQVPLSVDISAANDDSEQVASDISQSPSSEKSLQESNKEEEDLRSALKGSVSLPELNRALVEWFTPDSDLKANPELLENTPLRTRKRRRRTMREPLFDGLATDFSSLDRRIAPDLVKSSSKEPQAEASRDFSLNNHEDTQEDKGEARERIKRRMALERAETLAALSPVINELSRSDKNEELIASLSEASTGLHDLVRAAMDELSELHEMDPTPSQASSSLDNLVSFDDSIQLSTSEVHNSEYIQGEPPPLSTIEEHEKSANETPTQLEGIETELESLNLLPASDDVDLVVALAPKDTLHDLVTPLTELNESVLDESVDISLNDGATQQPSKTFPTTEPSAPLFDSLRPDVHSHPSVASNPSVDGVPYAHESANRIPQSQPPLNPQPQVSVVPYAHMSADKIGAQKNSFDDPIKPLKIQEPVTVIDEEAKPPLLNKGPQVLEPASSRQIFEQSTTPKQESYSKRIPKRETVPKRLLESGRPLERNPEQNIVSERNIAQLRERDNRRSRTTDPRGIRMRPTRKKTNSKGRSSITREPSGHHAIVPQKASNNPYLPALPQTQLPEPQDTTNQGKAEKLFEQALRDKAAGRWGSARTHIALALALAPNNRIYAAALENLTPASAKPSVNKVEIAQQLYEKATVAQNMGDYVEAINFLEQALKISRQPALLNRLAVLHATHLKNFELAENLLREAINMAPGKEVYERNLKKVLGLAAERQVDKDRGSSKSRKRSLWAILGITDR